jgi:hypothetical protein
MFAGLSLNRLRVEFAVVFSFVFLAVLVSGCNDAGPPVRHDVPPTSIASSLEFNDTVMGAGFGGDLVIQRGTGDNDASSYVLRWAAGGAPLAQNSYIGRAEITRTDESSLTIPFSVLSVPSGADSLLVLTSNATGEATTGISVAVANIHAHPNAPKSKAVSIQFTDDAYYQVDVGGSVYVTANAGDYDVFEYVVRYAGADGCVLPGEPALRIRSQRRSTRYTYYKRLYYTAPPVEARSLVVLASNYYGEAYESNCNNYVRSSLTGFNRYYASTIPYYSLERAFFQADDSNDTHLFSATLEIQPSKDERDLSTGYYVNWYSTSAWGTQGCGPAIRYFPKTGGKHFHTFNNFEIPLGRSQIVVSTGRECVGTTTTQPPTVITLNNLPAAASWYQIKNADNGHCISAGDRDGDAASSTLSAVACDANDISQRFTVRHVYDEHNDDLHQIFSVKTGGCFRREYWSGVWDLEYTCDDTSDLWTQMELRYLLSDDKAGKKITVRNQVAGLWNYACAWAGLPPTITSTWGNCGVKDIAWYFMPNGDPRPQNFAMFNDQ